MLTDVLDECNAKVAALEATLAERDAEIQRLRAELDAIADAIHLKRGDDPYWTTHALATLAEAHRQDSEAVDETADSDDYGVSPDFQKAAVYRREQWNALKAERDALAAQLESLKDSYGHLLADRNRTQQLHDVAENGRLALVAKVYDLEQKQAKAIERFKRQRDDAHAFEAKLAERESRAERDALKAERDALAAKVQALEQERNCEDVSAAIREDRALELAFSDGEAKGRADVLALVRKHMRSPLVNLARPGDQADVRGCNWCQARWDILLPHPANGCLWALAQADAPAKETP